MNILKFLTWAGPELKSHLSAKRNWFKSEMLYFITTKAELGLDCEDFQVLYEWQDTHHSIGLCWRMSHLAYNNFINISCTQTSWFSEINFLNLILRTFFLRQIKLFSARSYTYMFLVCGEIQRKQVQMWISHSARQLCISG
jgi:hypothetical protein